MYIYIYTYICIYIHIVCSRAYLQENIFEVPVMVPPIFPNICVCVCTCIVCVTTMDTGKKAYQVLAGNYLRKWYVFVDIVGTHIIQMHIHTTVFSFKFVSGG